MAIKFQRVELEFCKDFTQKLLNHPLSIPFRRPVDPDNDNAPDYFSIIKEPMDLGKISSKLENGEYSNSQEWLADIDLVWANAKQYNAKKNLIFAAAEILSKKSDKIKKIIPKTEVQLWSLRLEKQNSQLKNFFKIPPPSESIIPRLPNLSLQHESTTS